MGSILRSLDETQLLSLKAVEFTGREPFVVDEIPDRTSRPAGTGNIFQRLYKEGDLQVGARIDDVTRITKLLASPAGIKFAGKQQLINSLTNYKKKAGKIAGIKQTAKTLATIVAQTGVSGTGLHLVSVIKEFTYLKGLSKVQENLPSLFLYSPRSGHRSLTRPIVKTEHFITQDKYRTYPLPFERATNGYEYLYDEEPESRSRLKPPIHYVPGEVHSKPYRKEDISGKIVNVRLKMSKNNLPTLKFSGTYQGVDKVNYLPPVTAPDEIGETGNLVPFKIILNRANNPPTYLYFRAHLDSLSDSYGGQWSPVQYIGRGETFHNFSVFNRNISFSFTVAAYSEAELLPLYQKLNLLVGSTAPTYTDAENTESPFMKGNFVRVTIGEYLSNIPGFFNSVNVNWDIQHPWEIKQNYYDKEQIKQPYAVTPIVPHILTVQCAFLPIHDFAAETGKPFIGPSDIMTRQPVIDFDPVTITSNEAAPPPLPDLEIFNEDFNIDDIPLDLTSIPYIRPEDIPIPSRPNVPEYPTQEEYLEDLTLEDELIDLRLDPLQIPGPLRLPTNPLPPALPAPNRRDPAPPNPSRRGSTNDWIMPGMKFDPNLFDPKTGRFRRN